MFLKRITTSHLLATVLALGVIHYGAQAAEKKGKSGTVSVTGCLQKGDTPDEYSITGDDGKKYMLRSTSVSLSDHLGHKVTVTGNMVRAGKHKDTEATSSTSSSAEHKSTTGTEHSATHTLHVTDLKMVSTSCSSCSTRLGDCGHLLNHPSSSERLPDAERKAVSRTLQ